MGLRKAGASGRLWCLLWCRHQHLLDFVAGPWQPLKVHEQESGLWTAGSSCGWSAPGSVGPLHCDLPAPTRLPGTSALCPLTPSSGPTPSPLQDLL